MTITIDRFSWKHLDHDHRRALLDHELTHIQVDVEKEFPRVTLRAHDFELGGFYEVAERHRAAAPEARVQRQILVRDERGQLLLPGFEIQKTIEDELVEDEALANKLGERAAAMMREMSGPYPVAKFSEAEEGPL